MVDSLAASEAADLATSCPSLSVGLHFVVQSSDIDIKNELHRQIDSFEAMTGRRPDHIDMHKSSASSTPDQAIDILREYCRANKLPTRGVDAPCIKSFGVNSQDASVEQLLRSIGEASGRTAELMTHVGYSDDYLREHSSYSDPREHELVSICSPVTAQYIKDKGIQLINWRQLHELDKVQASS